MTMNDMVKHLENSGFIVDKTYDSDEKTYIFTISKGKAGCVGRFKYPEYCTELEKDKRQRMFLDLLVDTFNSRFAERDYVRNDVESTQKLYDAMKWHGYANLHIKNVIFNCPATIVFWSDGTKSVVKTQQGDTFDPEKGLAMAISKKMLGNDYAYYNIFKKWLKKERKTDEDVNLNLNCDFSSAVDAVNKWAESLKRTFGRGV